MRVQYLRGQRTWFVNYAERYRACQRVETRFPKRTTKFLVNRRIKQVSANAMVPERRRSPAWFAGPSTMKRLVHGSAGSFIHAPASRTLNHRRAQSFDSSHRVLMSAIWVPGLAVHGETLQQIGWQTIAVGAHHDSPHSLERKGEASAAQNRFHRPEPRQGRLDSVPWCWGISVRAGPLEPPAARS